jgi:hypothetical protein
MPCRQVMGAQKPGFLGKYCVVAHRFGKNPVSLVTKAIALLEVVDGKREQPGTQVTAKACCPKD